MNECHAIIKHYSEIWATVPEKKKWDKGPVSELPNEFCVLEFQPSVNRSMWTYATCCMSQPSDLKACELHLFSPVQNMLHVELLTVIAHYHRTGMQLGLGHTVNFGRPWLPGSRCDYGLLSLPYLDGPALEILHLPGSNRSIRFLWLIPITQRERDYKREHGLEALERKCEALNFNYLDPYRDDVV